MARVAECTITIMGTRKGRVQLSPGRARAKACREEREKAYRGEALMYAAMTKLTSGSKAEQQLTIGLKTFKGEEIDTLYSAIESGKVKLIAPKRPDRYVGMVLDPGPGSSNGSK
jgi:hypothetical protein